MPGSRPSTSRVVTGSQQFLRGDAVDAVTSRRRQDFVSSSQRFVRRDLIGAASRRFS
jgi:hypothetical protein